MADETEVGEGYSTTNFRGPRVVNEYADRSVKNHLITEIELKGLGRTTTFMTLAFSVAAWAIGFGLDSVREYQLAGEEERSVALNWILVNAVIAVPFLIAGIVNLYHRYTIVRDVRKGHAEQNE